MRIQYVIDFEFTHLAGIFFACILHWNLFFIFFLLLLFIPIYEFVYLIDFENIKKKEQKQLQNYVQCEYLKCVAGR